MAPSLRSPLWIAVLLALIQGIDTAQQLRQLLAPSSETTATPTSATSTSKPSSAPVTSSPVTPTGAPTSYIHDTVSLTIVCVFSGLLLVALCCAYYWCCTSSSKPAGYKAVPQ